VANLPFSESHDTLIAIWNHASVKQTAMWSWRAHFVIAPSISSVARPGSTKNLIVQSPDSRSHMGTGSSRATSERIQNVSFGPPTSIHLRLAVSTPFFMPYRVLSTNSGVRCCHLPPPTPKLTIDRPLTGAPGLTRPDRACGASYSILRNYALRHTCALLCKGIDACTEPSTILLPTFPNQLLNLGMLV
jgi:hypothetical protein